MHVYIHVHVRVCLLATVVIYLLPFSYVFHEINIQMQYYYHICVMHALDTIHIYILKIIEYIYILKCVYYTAELNILYT